MELIPLEVFYFRGVERLLIIFVAFTCILLGYKLFKHGITELQSAEWETSSFTFKLTRVSPGTFFAILGTAVLLWAISAQLAGPTLAPAQNPNAALSPPQENSDTQIGGFSWLGDASQNTLLKSFNTLIGVIDDDVIASLSERQRQGIIEALFNLKLSQKAILKKRFGEENFKIFEQYYDDFLLGQSVPEEHLSLLIEMNEALAENFVRDIQ